MKMSFLLLFIAVLKTLVMPAPNSFWSKRSINKRQESGTIIRDLDNDPFTEISLRNSFQKSFK